MGAADQEREDTEQVLSIVAELVRSLRGRASPVDLDTSLEGELGLGSLERMELARRIEQRFDVALSEPLSARAETPRELVAALRASVTHAEAPAPPPLEAGSHAGAPERASTLVEVLEWHAAAHGDRVHLRVLGDDGTHEDISYEALFTGARSVAAGLVARGARPGETIGLMLPTSRAYFEAFCAVLLAGSIPVPLYPPARATQIVDHLRRQGRILANADARLMIAAPEVERAAQVAASVAPHLRAIVTTDDLARSDRLLGAPRPSSDEVALVQYTSGSTGDPKGVVLTHANLLANVRSMGEAIEASPDDVFVSWLPLYHDMGLIGAWMGALTYGFPLVVMSPLAFLARPVRWLRAIHDHRGTLSAAPNFAYELCITKIDDRELAGIDLGSWRFAFNGAEPISPRTLRRFAERFEPYGFRSRALAPVYGLAECAVGLAFPPPERGPIYDRARREALARDGRAVPAEPDDPDAVELVGCGRALPRHAIRVVDASGREAPPRAVGRIEFRGPSTTRGYLHDAEATRRLFHGGWLDSGDLGYLADGELFLTGRAKDLIIRGGRNLHPHEIEEVAGLVAGVRRGGVAAFATQDPRDSKAVDRSARPLQVLPSARRARSRPAPARASTPVGSGERLIVVAETRERDPAERQRVRERIVAAITERVGVPPDEVVLAPPRAVRKTSSGKVRRAATRAAWEQGALGGDERPSIARLRLLALALRSARAAVVRRARSVRGAIQGARAWSALVVIALLAWLPIVLLPGADRRRRLARGAARLLCRVAGVRVDVDGLERLPRDRACVLVSNHASYVDPLVLLAALPADLRYGFVAKGELAEHAIVRLPLERMGVEMVRRWDAPSSVEDARRLVGSVRAGRSLLVYPEATIGPMAGLLPFRLGAFVAATEGGAPLVPIALRGTRSILPPGRWRPMSGVVRVSIGEPISPQDESFESAVALRDRARNWIVRHAGEPDLPNAWEPARDAAPMRRPGGGARGSRARRATPAEDL